ncbi:FAD-dependent thymidylate synthase [Candidatus Hepatincolaceae symbiont of Richtersius coronifer]
MEQKNNPSNGLVAPNGTDKRQNDKNQTINQTNQEQSTQSPQDKYYTSRSTNSMLEEMLFKEQPVLDKGFIRLVDYMGGDEAIVQAARVSYGKGTKTLNDDRALIRYLLKHKHTTPFEMCEIKFHIKTPLFIARQWLRHRTASVNEYSARYSIMEEDYYIPNLEQIKTQSVSNKQGRGEEFSSEKANVIRKELQTISKEAFGYYYNFLEENGEINNSKGATNSQNNLLQQGTSAPEINSIPSKPILAKEIARIILPVNVYTQFYWKINLHNLLHFLKLRADYHAQYEIREYAIKILEVVKLWVPVTYQAFLDYSLNAKLFSQQEVALIKHLIEGKEIKMEDSGLSKREWAEFNHNFKGKD